MKLSLFTALICLICSLQNPPKKVIFFGDSITEMGVQPKGYISLMQQNLSPSEYQLIGAGIGGNKVYDLYLRLEEDVLKQKPDIVFIYVGINDVWHKTDFGTGTDIDKYEKFYRAIIQKIKTAGARVVCVTPTFIGEKWDASNPQDGDLNQYSKVIRKIAADTGSGLVDLRQIFLEYSKANNPENSEKGILTYDRVHLNDVGNKFVADTFLEALKNINF